MLYTVHLKHVFAMKAASEKVKAKNVENSLHRLVTACAFVLVVKAVELTTEISFDVPMFPRDQKFVFSVLDGRPPRTLLVPLNNLFL